MTIQVSQNELNSIRKYCILLEEIKLRINSVMEIIDERKNKEQNLNMEEMIQFHMKTEFICLQIRKILELIIFGTMVANQEVYKKTYSDFKNHWNVRKIMRKIEIINKNYYPIAMSFGDSKLNDDGINYTHELNVLNTEFLTKEEFIKLYDKCSEIIHSPNPFQNNHLINFEKTLEDWMYKIVSLIYIHQIKLVNSKHTWLITLNYSPNGKINVQLLDPV
ncbi:hypothetical protein HG533_02460 [Moraxella osloensis]|nr:hypothetical protein [Moraxella osloensis]MBW4017679.1 hypothetical protein [Moraxella osloensis]